jgi:hypothetical protein
MKFPAVLGLSISTISVTRSLEDPTPVAAAYPSAMLISSRSTEGNEIAFFSLPPVEDAETRGSEANAGGGPRGSVAETG